MRSRLPDYTVRTAAVALMSVVLVACRSDSVVDPVDPEHQHHTNPTVAASVSGAIKADVARLRNVVAPLHQLSAAQEAGFNLALSPCVASPAGGMGFHWGNMSRIDATVKWDEPEVLVFAPSPDSKDGVKLAAVEYIVPMALSAQAPVLFGETFVPGGPGNSMWTLHVWVGIHNPAGIFAPWNPRVSCP
jgi:hypothetical protein